MLGSKSVLRECTWAQNMGRWYHFHGTNRAIFMQPFSPTNVDLELVRRSYSKKATPTNTTMCGHDNVTAQNEFPLKNAGSLDLCLICQLETKSVHARRFVHGIFPFWVFVR